MSAIAVIGTGYVGLTTAVCLANLGHQVVGVDIDEAKVARLQSGQATIYEPGLEELMRETQKSGRLVFTSDYREGIPAADFVFIAVGTPPGRRGAHRDEDELRTRDGLVVVAGEREAAALEHAGQQRIEAGLINRRLAGTQPGHFGLVDVHTGNPMPQVGQAYGGGQSDVAGPDDGDRTHFLQSVTKRVRKPPPGGKSLQSATGLAHPRKAYSALL